MGDFSFKDAATVVVAGTAGFFLGGPAGAALGIKSATAAGVAGAALAGSTALGIGASVKAAGAQEVELELAKRKESQEFRDREVQRKRRIAAVLGSQAAEAAARGIQMSGSVANISITDAKRAGEETFIDDVNSRARISALSRRRRTIASQSRLRTATSIMGLGTRFAQAGAFDRKQADGGGGSKPIGRGD